MGAVAKYCDEYVCVYVCVCLFVRENISGITLAIFTRFVRVAMAGSSFSVVAIRYVLPVLWMTSGFLSIMGRIAV